jgi:hypothetical protein
MLMGICTRASGEMIKQTVMEYLLMPTMQFTQENGLMIPNMDMVKSSGIMALHAIKDSSTKEKRMVKEDLTGKMEAIMMANSLMASSKDLESTTLLILIRRIKASLDSPTWRAEEWRLGPTVVAMKEISKTVRKTVKGLLNGPTATNI